MSNFLNTIKKFNNKTALVSEGTRITYKELNDSILNIKKKIKPYSIALLIAQNNTNFIKGYISFLTKKNVISIVVDESFDKKFFNEIIKKYKPNYILLPSYLKKEIKNNKKILLQFYDYLILKTTFRHNKFLNYKNFLLLSTSGTTQNPKFVRLSFDNINFNTQSIIKYLKINSHHCTITTMPLGYSYGLSILNTHLASGAKVIINKKTIFENKFWEILKSEKVNSFGGVPEFYEFLIKIGFEKRITKHLKYITQAGGKLGRKTLKQLGYICKKNKTNFYVMYGQAEASPRMAFLEWKNFFKYLGSVGQPLNGCKFIIQDKNKKNVSKKFKKGEIIFYGKNVCLGYADSILDLYKGDENKGILMTNDIGRMDQKKNLYIIGRKDKVVKIFGKRVNLTDLENLLKRKNLISNCNYNKPFLKIHTNDLKKSELIKKTVSNFLKINSNLIIINKTNRISLKSYKQ